MNGGSDFRPLRTGAANRTALLEKLNQGREGRVQISGEGGGSTGLRAQKRH